jgi:uncharacterized protein (DUF3084 family)
MDENVKISSNLEVLKKQASGVSTEYMRLLKEQPASASSSSSSPDELAKENRELKERVSELSKSLEKAQQEVQTVKKQAQNQSDAYMQLAEENKKLTNRLDDYSLLLGDAQKKKV